MIKTLQDPTPEMIEAAKRADRIIDELEDLYITIRSLTKDSRLRPSVTAFFSESASRIRSVEKELYTARSRLVGGMQTHACEGFKEVPSYDE